MGVWMWMIVGAEFLLSSSKVEIVIGRRPRSSSPEKAGVDEVGLLLTQLRAKILAEARECVSVACSRYEDPFDILLKGWEGKERVQK